MYDKNEILYGKCVLSIRFECRAEYLKWKKYADAGESRKWDFLVNYPAIMRAEYIFHKIEDVEAMTRKIVQLLQLGFNVYSADWRLEDYKSQLEV